MAAETLYEVPSWIQIYDMMLNQAQKIRGDGYKPDVIVGIAKGGLVPSRILADLLETRDFAVITIEYYVGINQKAQEPILKQCLHTQLTGKRVLLVDDVSDCGRSLQVAKKHLEEQCAREIRIATIYCKPGTITRPDYFERETSSWIVFPWEARETLTKIRNKKNGDDAARAEVTRLVKAGMPEQLTKRLLSEEDEKNL